MPITFTASARSNDIVRGTADSDILFGDDGDDAMNGAAGNDLLVGGGGDDRIHGGDGNDLLIGGSGADTFSFSGFGGTIGRDYVLDFAPDEGDALNFSFVDGINDVEDVLDAAIQDGRNTVIDTDEGEIVIVNFDVSDLTADMMSVFG